MALLDFLRIPPGAVLLAFAADGPALKGAFLDKTMPPHVAIERFVIIAFVLSIAWKFLYGVIRDYARQNDEEQTRQNISAMLNEKVVDGTTQTAVLPVVVDHDASQD